jgi:VIT1/CCC1 family predicted Fe2+/Mn2+ transporter
VSIDGAAPTNYIDRPPPERAGWLRAAVLGANDGIVSTTAIVLGVSASDASPRSVLIAGFASLVAGAASMAAGEYISVSSQRDLEQALRRREQELEASHPNVALTELAVVLQLHGIDPGLARRVAQQITAAEPIDASVRVKYGITEALAARPLQAALASATSFAVGSAVPLLGMLAPTLPQRIAWGVALALASLVFCGALAGGASGSSRTRSALRVVLGGGIAMAVSFLLGRLVGVVV